MDAFTGLVDDFDRAIECVIVGASNSLMEGCAALECWAANDGSTSQRKSEELFNCR